MSEKIILREALTILPKLDNNGKEVSLAHDILLNDLITHFGGATTFEVNGCWKDKGKVYKEAGIAYSVAINGDTYNRKLFVSIAVYAAKLARQLAVYVRHHDGEVEIIDCDEWPKG